MGNADESTETIIKPIKTAGKPVFGAFFGISANAIIAAEVTPAQSRNIPTKRPKYSFGNRDFIYIGGRP